MKSYVFIEWILVGISVGNNYLIHVMVPSSFHV